MPQGKLDRFNGHFLNWYDTTTLTPLRPQYVSTVDSGNLAGHLLALKQVCIEIAERPLIDGRVIDGLIDTVSLMREEAGKLGAVRQSTGAVTLKQLRGEIDQCATSLSIEAPGTLSGWSGLLQKVTARINEIDDIIGALAHEHGNEQFEQLSGWTHSLTHHCGKHNRDFATLAPWASALTSVAAASIASCSEESLSEWNEVVSLLDRVPTLDELTTICGDAQGKLSQLQHKIEQCNRPDRDKALKQLKALMSRLEDGSRSADALA